MATYKTTNEEGVTAFFRGMISEKNNWWSDVTILNQKQLCRLQELD